MSEYVATGKVVFEYRDLTVLDGDSGQSVRAAEAAACAADQGKYWQYHETLFLNREGGYSDERLEAMARTIGLDVDQFSSCLDDNEHLDEIMAGEAEARSQNINATPTVLVNGQRVDNWAWDNLKAAIEAALNNQ